MLITTATTANNPSPKAYRLQASHAWAQLPVASHTSPGVTRNIVKQTARVLIRSIAR